MQRIIYLFMCIISIQCAFGQTPIRELFPKTAFTLQYAGSTGFMTGGFSKVSNRDKLELGMLYGFLPQVYGGPIHSLNLKLTYNPIHINFLKTLSVEPLQTGMFLSQSFGKNLGFAWESHYPRGYYWWTKSLRFHLFLGTQIAYKFDKTHLDRLAFYLEANTNDFYLSSYIPSKGSIRLYDIFFLGTGLKLYLK